MYHYKKHLKASTLLHFYAFGEPAEELICLI
jgi:hypothetical protein